MTNEIKMIYAQAEEQLKVLEMETDALNPKVDQEIVGNLLDVATKLNSVAKDLESLLTTYQTLLLHNVQTSKNSVQYMKEQDEKISAAINGAVLNKPYVTY